MKTPAIIFLGGALLLLVTGCQTTSSQRCGDARLYRTEVHFSLFPELSPRYRIELPKVTLAKGSTNIFAVRNLPVELANYSVLAVLYMKLPPADHSSLDRENTGRILPWQNSVLAWEVRAEDGKIIDHGLFQLGDLSWNYEPDQYWGWNATSPLPQLWQALQGRANYQIIITVIKPSPRHRDFIQLKTPDDSEARPW